MKDKSREKRIIDKLRKQKQEVEEKLTEIEIDSRIREEDINREYEKLRNLIIKLNESKLILDDAIKDANQCREEYYNAKKEMVALKIAYKKKMDSFLKQMGCKID